MGIKDEDWERDDDENVSLLGMEMKKREEKDMRYEEDWKRDDDQDGSRLGRSTGTRDMDDRRRVV